MAMVACTQKITPLTPHFKLFFLILAISLISIFFTVEMLSCAAAILPWALVRVFLRLVISPLDVSISAEDFLRFSSTVFRKSVYWLPMSKILFSYRLINSLWVVTSSLSLGSAAFIFLSWFL